MIDMACQPGPPLGRYVALLWVHESGPLGHARERLLPTGTVELVFNLRADRLRVFGAGSPLRASELPGAIVCGPHSRPFWIDASEKAAVIGAHFRIGGAFPLLPFPAAELHNQVVALAELWGGEAAELRGRLAEAPSHAERLALLERALAVRLARPAPPNPAVAAAVAGMSALAAPGRPVAQAAGRAGYTPRRLAQLFHAEVGLSPKLLQRVRRFQRAIALVGDEPRVDWAAVAVGLGYYDQAHFANDFRDFAGLTPTDYLRGRGPRRNHLPAE